MASELGSRRATFILSVCIRHFRVLLIFFHDDDDVDEKKVFFFLVVECLLCVRVVGQDEKESRTNIETS